MKLLIIQTSPHRTASTLLVNALYGLVPEYSNKKILCAWRTNLDKKLEDIIILKHHCTDIDKLMKGYKDGINYKVVFICSERKEINALIDPKYKTYDNTVVFSFEELNETKDNPLVEIVDNIYTKVKKVLPENIQLDKSKCIERLNKMNATYENIKNKDFSYVNSFYELHGSHRNRTNHE